VGLPLGAAPPPGLYTGLSILYGVNSFAHGNQALPTPTNFPSLGVGVPILWSTPWNIFGASYSAAAVQGFYVAAPDGSQAPSNFAAGGGPQLNPDYWSFEPGWAISYLSKDWTASANFLYVINMGSKGTCCGLGGPVPTAPGKVLSPATFCHRQRFVH
ncbi:MAG TPA: hypothetical protein VMF32_17035, partial [Xanthobacteraceae bacterium]|nr:hypothetical protein [Xanthobacteraceae bacterium]